LIKKEARILGLAAPTKRLKRVPVIGVVYRGNLWLDGMFKCQVQRDPHGRLSGLVKAIVQSRQYTQIHAVVLSKEDLAPGIRINISDFSRKIDLPVLSIVKKTGPSQGGATTKVERLRIKIAGRLVHVRAAGLSREEAGEIFAVACTSGQWLPEAVRVAQIVAEQATRCENSPVPRASASNA
jgi:endonuclease V-like protein UPF0215 family